MKTLAVKMDPEKDPNSHEEFKEVVQSVCAQYLGGPWKNASTKDFALERISGGMSNLLFLCALCGPSDSTKNAKVPRKVVLRVYCNPDMESQLLPQTLIFALLAERQLGPKLYGAFDDGRLEEYLPSRPLACAEIGIPKISDKIARLLARVHQIDVPVSKDPDYVWEASSRWLRQLSKLVDKNTRFKLPEKFHKWSPEYVTCKDLVEELQYLRTTFTANCNSPVAFCHNDLQEGNVLLVDDSAQNSEEACCDDGQNGSESDCRMVIIDYEYASYNYRGFDFANHFDEYTLNYAVDTPPYFEVLPDRMPSEERMEEFMVSYLKERNPDFDSDALRTKAKAMVKETLPFIPISHFFWAIWAFLQAETSSVVFGYREYGQDRLGIYYEKKHLIDQLKRASAPVANGSSTR
ncbi:choline/ethanolamine kinase [Aphelenchoides avenae]|nr:choline/ethanolamine kinase [Aphelenchus avenae]